jgi:hypothetical protein
VPAEPDSFRWSLFFGGRALVVFFMLAVEVVVYELVDATSKLAGGIYNHAVTAYESFEKPAAAEAQDPAAPAPKPSAAAEIAGHNDHIAKENMALRCLQEPHSCN